MKISKKERRSAKELFRLCIVEGVPDEQRVRQVVQYIVDVRSRGHLGVFEHLLRLLKMDRDRRNAQIESAVPLDSVLQTAVRTSLARVYGPDLEISFTPKAALLGGMRIQVGSDVYDASVQGRLAALERSF